MTLNLVTGLSRYNDVDDNKRLGICVRRKIHKARLSISDIDFALFNLYIYTHRGKGEADAMMLS